MKRIIIFLSVLSVLSTSLIAQTYSFEMRMDNFQQVNETEFQWDIYLRKGAGSEDFALYTMQFRLDFNNLIMNGGQFESSFLTIHSTDTDLHQKVGWFTDEDFTFVGTAPSHQFNWGTTNAPAGGQEVTVISDTWLKVASFSAQLRKDGGPHHFSDMNPSLAFEASGINVIVRRCDWSGSNPNATMLGEVNYEVPRHGTSPALGTPLPTRQLAGYFFTGNGSWGELARWNNVTESDRRNSLPYLYANAIIAGNATITDGASISLTPSGGNGGELTLIAGQEQLYTLTLSTTNQAYQARVRENHGAPGDAGTFILTVNPGSTGSLSLPAGFQMRLYTSDADFVGGSFTEWADNVGIIGVTQNGMNYTMPSKNITVTAVWNPSGKKSDTGIFSQDENESNSAKNSLLSSLTIAPGSSLTVDKLFNETGSGAEAIVINSDISGLAGSLIHNNSGVAATINRIFEQGHNNHYHFISSPLAESTTFGSIFPAGDLTKIWVRTYNEGSGEWVNQLAEHSMNSGTGYSFYMNIPQTIATFDGTINTGNIAVPLSNSGASGVPDLDGWNLVGNPFASALNWDDETWVKTNTTGQVAVWDGSYNNGSGNYLIRAGNVGTLIYGIIPPHQAMFVKATSVTGAEFAIPASARVHNSQALYKSEPEAANNTLRLDITNEANNYWDAAFIRFHPDATEGIDNNLDAHKLFGEDEAPQLFFRNGDTNLSIMALPAIEDMMEVSLNAQVGVNSTYTISVSGIESFDPGQPVYLYDVLAETLTDLRVKNEYSFQAAPEQEVPRFVLKFHDATVNTPDLNTRAISLYSYGRTIYTNLPEAIDAEVFVTNMLGQRVFTTKVTGEGLHHIETGLKPGIYILSLRSGEISQSKRIILQ